MAKELILQKEAAELLGVSAVTLRSYTKAGKIQSTRISNKQYYVLAEVLEMAEKIKANTPIETQKEEPTAEQLEQLEPVKFSDVKEEDFTKLDELISSTMTPAEQIERHKRKRIFELLESDPPKGWLKILEGEASQTGQPVFDLPIEKVDFLLSYLFTWWRCEIKEFRPILKNSFSITVRLHYLDLEGKENFSDGVGVITVENEAEARKLIPIAETLARKNAAKKIGKIFGRDVNRDVKPIKTKENKKPKVFFELTEKISNSETLEDLEELTDLVYKTGDNEIIKKFKDAKFSLS